MSNGTHIRRNPGLWFAIWVGPIAWTVHLLLSYALVPVTCATGLDIILHAVTAATALVTMAGAIVAFPRWVEAEKEQRGRAMNGPRTGYQRFMAGVGVLMSLVFVFVIVLEGLPVFFVDPCLSFE